MATLTGNNMQLHDGSTITYGGTEKLQRNRIPSTKTIQTYSA